MKTKKVTTGKIRKGDIVVLYDGSKISPRRMIGIDIPHFLNYEGQSAVYRPIKPRVKARKKVDHRRIDLATHHVRDIARKYSDVIRVKIVPVKSRKA